MSGSSWYFKRFNYLAVKTLDGEDEISIWKMADFINFEADIKGDNEEIDEEDGKVSNISDVDCENSFIDNQEITADVNFYRHFANVVNDIDQVLKDA